MTNEILDKFMERRTEWLHFDWIRRTYEQKKTRMARKNQVRVFAELCDVDPYLVENWLRYRGVIPVKEPKMYHNVFASSEENAEVPVA